jgi:hypothetical protein
MPSISSRPCCESLPRMPKETDMAEDMDTQTWQTLMDRVVADYQPGISVLAPGGGGIDDDPMGLRYAKLGGLALMMNEGLDAATNRGADRDALLDAVAEQAEGFSRADVDAILSGSQKCPDAALLQAFCNALSIDVEDAVDAAVKGGCTNYGASTVPPGY